MDDFIRFDCPACGKSIKAKPEHAGKQAKCPRKTCGTTMRVPEPLRLSPERQPRRIGLWIAGAVGLILALGTLGTWLMIRSPNGRTPENSTTDKQVASARTTPAPSTPASDKKGINPDKEQSVTKKQGQRTDKQPKGTPEGEPNKTDTKEKTINSSPWKEVRQFVGHAGAISSIAVSKDGKHLLTAGGSFGDKTLRLWDIRTGQEVRQFKGHTHDIDSAVISSDGTRVLSGGSDGTVRLWDIATGGELQVFKGHQANRQRVSVVTSVALSPDGRWVVSGGDDGLRMWDTKTSKETRRFAGLTAPVNAVCFSPDGTQFVSASGNSEPSERRRPDRDNLIRLWDVKSGELVREFKGHQYGIFTVAFSPDGTRLASGSGDKTIRLWDVKTGDEVQCLKGHTGEVRSIAFSPDGQKLLSAGGWNYLIGSEKPGEISYRLADDGTVRLWDLRGGKELHRSTDCQKGYRQAVAFSIAGIHALFCTAKHTVMMVEISK